MRLRYLCSFCGLATTNRDRYRAHVPCPHAAGYVPLTSPKAAGDEMTPLSLTE